LPSSTHSGAREFERYEPDAAARAYSRVIASEPTTVRKALAARTKPRL
jgi:hypothetical protein